LQSKKTSQDKEKRILQNIEERRRIIEGKRRSIG
jgi:hypothetical protein